jgi:calcineurin-like phosphoesterase family protein
MTVRFTSDTHFGDHRVLNLYPRPFQSTAEMDGELVRRWNETVAPPGSSTSASTCATTRR